MDMMSLPYLVGVVMISDLAQHNPTAALTVWHQYQAPIQLVFQKNERIADQFALSLCVLVAMAKAGE